MTAMSLYSNVIFKTRYARWREEEKRREMWDETVERYVAYFTDMLAKRHGYVVTETERDEVFNSIYALDVMPSMRALMTAGVALNSAEVANFNCSFEPVDSIRSFTEHMYVLMCGAGSGFSVERRFTQQLPSIPATLRPINYTIVVEDSRQGWCDALHQLLTHLYDGLIPGWDTSKVREEGARLKTFGGYASGPGPLIELFQHTIAMFKAAAGRRFRPIEVFSIMCYIAQIVVVGGVRRSATIALFDHDDNEMRTAKTGQWWVKNPHYAMANVSGVFESRPDHAEFSAYWNDLVASKSGEPGMLNRAALWRQCEAIGRKTRYADGTRIPFGVNPCSLPAEQIIMTADGPRRIHDLVGVPSKVRVDGELYQATPFIQTAVKEVFDVTTKEGFSFAGTDNHEFQLVDGKWVYLRDLKPGDSVRVHKHRHRPNIDQNQVELGWLLGEVVGDGGHNPEKYPTYVRFWGDEAVDMVPYARGLMRKHFPSHHQSTDSTSPTVACVGLTEFASKHLSPLHKSILDPLELGNDGLVLGFIAGYFDADGSMIGTREKGFSARLASVDYPRLQQVQRMLARFGVYSKIYRDRKKAGATLLPDGNGGKREYPTQAMHELVVSRCSLERFFEIVPLRTAKLSTLGGKLKDRRRAPYASSFGATVESVTLRGVEPVFDARVETVECFDANGVVAHNSEIILQPYSFCNLSGVAIRPDDTLEDLKRKIRLATIIGTWQACVVQFEYLRPQWQENCEDERLLGVCLAGIMDHPVLKSRSNEAESWLMELRDYAWAINKEYADRIGINPTASITSVKPAGNSGELYDVASGIHPRYAKQYIRTIRQSGGDPITSFLRDNGIPWEISKQNARDVVFSFPVKAPEGAITAPEISALQQLDHWLMVKTRYSTHTVSATIYVRENEWDEVGAWVYEHFDNITGLSFLPYNEHTYEQAPYQPITEDEYRVAVASMPDDIDWSLLKFYERTDTTTVSQDFACTAGKCELV